MISIVLRIYGGSSCVFIFNLIELTSCLNLPHVDRYAPLKYFYSSSMFDFKVKLYESTQVVRDLHQFKSSNNRFQVKIYQTEYPAYKGILIVLWREKILIIRENILGIRNPFSLIYEKTFSEYEVECPGAIHN